MAQVIEFILASLGHRVQTPVLPKIIQEWEIGHESASGRRQGAMQYNEGDEGCRRSRKKQTKVWRDLGGTGDMFEEVGVGFLTLILL
jgi:hypothetical protein